MVGVEREVVAHVLETMQVLETERSDESQLHVEDAVFVVRSQHKIAVGVTNRLTTILNF